MQQRLSLHEIRMMSPGAAWRLASLPDACCADEAGEVTALQVHIPWHCICHSHGAESEYCDYHMGVFSLYRPLSCTMFIFSYSTLTLFVSLFHTV